jgi:MFS family permease
MSAKREEFRRAWRVVLASALGAGTGAIPLAFYSFGAFVDPLGREFGWSRAEITSAPLFLTIGGLVAGVFAGALADRIGSRRVVLVSQVLLALCFAGLSLMPPSLPLFYFGYALLAIMGAGTMTMTWTRAITGWFSSARGIALGISLVGTGTIGAFLPAYVNMLTEAYGWRGAYLGLALLPLIFGLPFTYLFFREPPEDGANSASGDGKKRAPADRSYDFGPALRSRCFWQMALSFSVVALAIASVIVHCVPLLTDRGIDKTTAAGLAGLIGISVTLGRLVSGYMLDHISAPRVAFLMFGLPALSCLILLVAGSNLWLCGLAIILVGLAGGAEHDIAAYFCAQYFGRRHYGKIYGLLYTLYGVGSGIGPLLTGRVADATGSYDNALYGGALLFALSALLIISLKPPPPLPAGPTLQPA